MRNTKELKQNRAVNSIHVCQYTYSSAEILIYSRRIDCLNHDRSPVWNSSTVRKYLLPSANLGCRSTPLLGCVSPSQLEDRVGLSSFSL